jgi:hypothetical protein
VAQRHQFASFLYWRPPEVKTGGFIAHRPPTAYNKTWLYFPLSDTTNYKQPATFDTWSFHYEMDGINEVTGTTTDADQGTDQIVAIQTGSSDYETSPPYPVPLRGVKIRIRCYEPDSRDVREVTVTESFVPQ